MPQLPLIAGLQASNLAAAERLMECVRTVDAQHAPKRAVMVQEIGAKSESHLSEAIRGKGKHFPLVWLPTYARFDRDELIGNEIASWHGCKLVPLRPRTATEKLRRLERVLESMGTTGDFIRERANALPDEPDEQLKEES